MWSDEVRTEAKSPSPPPQEREGGGIMLWGGELVPHFIQNTHTHTQGCSEIPAFKQALRSVSRSRTSHTSASHASPSSSTQAARSRIPVAGKSSRRSETCRHRACARHLAGRLRRNALVYRKRHLGRREWRSNSSDPAAPE
jgi:hypothetical protein